MAKKNGAHLYALPSYAPSNNFGALKGGEFDEQILSMYYKDGMSLSAIAREFGVTHNAILARINIKKGVCIRQGMSHRSIKHGPVVSGIQECLACSDKHKQRGLKTDYSKQRSRRDPVALRFALMAGNSTRNLVKDSGIYLPFTKLSVSDIYELWYAQQGHCALGKYCRLLGVRMSLPCDTGYHHHNDEVAQYGHLVPRKHFRLVQDLRERGENIPWVDPHARVFRGIVHRLCNYHQGTEFLEGLRSPLTGELLPRVVPEEFMPAPMASGYRP